jgi:hypothetical protein
MHLEMADLLASRHEVVFHDLRDGPGILAQVEANDVVYAGSGPYAYLYHLWRATSGKSFRIVREVHTTLWSGFWSQEELCTSYRRPGDVVLFPSEFARRLFVEHLDGRRLEDSAVAYPMMHRLPRRRSAPGRCNGTTLRIGYLGALSKAKNFDQVVAVFAACYRQSGGQASLAFAGKPSISEGHPDHETIVRELVDSGIDQEAIISLGVLSPASLASLFDRIDVLLFPSTASRESLGRVILEALAYNVPVVAADIGPAVELLPPANRVPTELKSGRSFTMGRIEALGRIDVQAATAMLIERKFEPAGIIDETPYTAQAFWEVLEGGPSNGAGKDIDVRLLERLHIDQRSGFDPERAIRTAEAVFAEFHGRRDEALLRRIGELELAEGQPRHDLRSLLGAPRNLADYRALPLLVDALVLTPLPYTLEATA